MAKEIMLVLGANSEKARRESFNGVEHLVVPVIALVEGVLHPANAPAPELALASEFGKHFQGWNGRPVVVNHPELNGQLVSANIPEVLEKNQIGQIFNTSVDGEKLRMEAWINLDKANELGGVIKETIDRVAAGDDVIEVSTGLFAETEVKSGKFNEEEFSGIWRHITPDHLAILSADKVGACSIEDGCGVPRINSSGAWSGCKCGGTKNQEFVPKDQNLLEKTISKAMIKIGLGPKASSEAKRFKKKFDEGLLVLKKHNKNHRSMSDTDTRSALQAALEAKDNPFAFVMAVFDGSFIFEDFMEGGMFEQSFSIEEDGTVILGEELVKVRPETDFIPVKTNEVNGMEKEEMVKGLIANEATKFAEKDQEWLMTLEEENLEKLIPQETSNTPSGEEPTPPKGEADGSAGEGEEEDETPPTVEEYIAKAPEEIREVLNESLELQRTKKEDLVKRLMAHADNKFSEGELKAMSTDQLYNITSLAHVAVDYSGRGGPRLSEVASNVIPPAPKVFETAKQAS